jgi:hypothetical protein
MRHFFTIAVMESITVFALDSKVAACKTNETDACKAGMVYSDLKFDATNFPAGTSKLMKIETYTKVKNLELLIFQEDRYGLPFDEQRKPMVDGYSEFELIITSMEPPSVFGDGFMNVKWMIVPKGEGMFSAIDQGESGFYNPYLTATVETTGTKSQSGQTETPIANSAAKLVLTIGVAAAAFAVLL